MPIVLFPHDPAWADQYAEAKARLLSALGTYALDIQHVGSTSVPGISAKPVIDIGVAISQYPLPDDVIAAVTALGYIYKGEYGIPRRHYFQKRTPMEMHNVHINELSNDQFQRHVLFRDYLRAHPDAARQYETVKQDLATRYEDVNQYADNKSEFVESTLAKARAWRDAQQPMQSRP